MSAHVPAASGESVRHHTFHQALVAEAADKGNIEGAWWWKCGGCGDGDIEADQTAAVHAINAHCRTPDA